MNKNDNLTLSRYKIILDLRQYFIHDFSKIKRDQYALNVWYLPTSKVKLNHNFGVTKLPFKQTIEIINIQVKAYFPTSHYWKLSRRYTVNEDKSLFVYLSYGMIITTRVKRGTSNCCWLPLTQYPNRISCYHKVGKINFESKNFQYDRMFK